MVNKRIEFVNNYLNALPFSDTTKARALKFCNALVVLDPLKKVDFELSFKITKDKISRSARILYLDADTYACKSELLFLSRIDVYQKIIAKNGINFSLSQVIKSLRSVARTPMDLYFGADIKNNYHLFAFWLIFGGIKDNLVRFWPYDIKLIIKNILSRLKLSLPAFLNDKVLNLGLDVDKNTIFYKLYYLYEPLYLKDADIINLKKQIGESTEMNDLFYFYSYMYDRLGNLIKKKLFIEFLKYIYPYSSNFKEFLKRIIMINRYKITLNEILSILNKIRGRISLISFENDKTLTFYLRSPICKD